MRAVAGIYANSNYRSAQIAQYLWQCILCAIKFYDSTNSNYVSANNSMLDIEKCLQPPTRDITDRTQSIRTNSLRCKRVWYYHYKYLLDKLIQY